MKYSIIKPPFTLRFRQMTRNELSAYAIWLKDATPQRIGELVSAVKRAPGFEDWEADFTPESLDRLGLWFADQVKTKLRAEGECEGGILASSEIPEEELTNETFSISIDVGLYLSRVLLKQHPSIHWEQSFSRKKDIDYGQPVLVGFGAAPFNPVRIMVTLAYGIASNTKTGQRLRDIYTIWANKLNNIV